MGAQLVLPGLPARSSTFDRWWDAAGEWVEEPNQRRDGESGVLRLRRADAGQPLLYCKRQRGHLYRSLRHPFGRPTALREYAALRAFERLGIRVPRMVYCAARKQDGRWQALLVTEALEGFVSLEDWYRGEARAVHGEALQRGMLRSLAQTLARLHRAGWQHGCLYPKHLFVRVRGQGREARVEIALLDLEKSRRRLLRQRASRRDLSQLRRHTPAMPASDWALFEAEYLHALRAAAEVADGF
ncbi:lipopolysaccharide kinase InaA family protein [Pseudomonas oligotrophica]|uniref:lipopolysaccharide kinase InaA family protein n=1 Tax=Pseudomonas oligotrophica TaxID=2912055 RepID=UPI001F32B4FC|nr:lipopolysaccharide kinase InaA family protein [Pseudomonas oligotrophica]MCF7201651.1 InaA protein [Pseudomonas oligotrophica]